MPRAPSLSELLASQAELLLSDALLPCVTALIPSWSDDATTHARRCRHEGESPLAFTLLHNAGPLPRRLDGPRGPERSNDAGRHVPVRPLFYPGPLTCSTRPLAAYPNPPPTCGYLATAHPGGKRYGARVRFRGLLIHVSVSSGPFRPRRLRGALAPLAEALAGRDQPPPHAPRRDLAASGQTRSLLFAVRVAGRLLGAANLVAMPGQRSHGTIRWPASGAGAGALALAPQRRPCREFIPGGTSA
jgi:hypothetical protein